MGVNLKNHKQRFMNYLFEISSSILYSKMLRNIFFWGLFAAVAANCCLSYLLPVLNTNNDEETKWVNSSIIKEDGHTIFYHKSDLLIMYNDALVHCFAEGGYLAEPRSSIETEAINTFLYPGYNVWIGLTDKESEGIFLWNSDGTGIDDYANWGGGRADGTGDCVIICGYMQDYRWNDVWCDHIVDYEPIYALCHKMADVRLINV